MFRKLALLCLATILVHFWIFFEVSITTEVSPMNDVALYGSWLDQIAQSGALLGINAPWVYPFVALGPMYLAKIIGGSAGIMTGWLILMMLLNVIGLSALVNWGREGKHAFVAAGYYLAFIAALGPVAIGRIDAPATFLAMLGLVQLYQGRQRLAVIFFTFGAWIKIWPVAAVVGLLANKIHRYQVLIVAATTSAAILAGGWLLGGNSALLSFITMQGNRGIQVESPVALAWLWAAFAKVPGVGIYFDSQLVTNQIFGSFTATAATLMDYLLVSSLVLIAWLAWRANKNGMDGKTLFVLTTGSIALDLIVFNKVGSPQYELWLAVPLMAGFLFQIGKWKFIGGTGLVIALMTNLIYPVFYIDVLSLGLLGLALLTARNILLVVLLVCLLRRLGIKQLSDQRAH